MNTVRMHTSHSSQRTHSWFNSVRLRRGISIFSIALALTATSFCVTKNYDGPAELPRVTVPSAMSDTPAPGAVISVNAGDDLQSALNRANCGDQVELQAGATFTGQFTLPAKNCDIKHWIWIRTSAPDSALPAEGQRATPCYAGVSSLDGRPQYSCNNPASVMATLEIDIVGAGPFKLAPNANYYRLIGLEVTRPAATATPSPLISGEGTADHIVIDRCWIHGAPQVDALRGVSISGMTNVAVVDSYFTDFHCIALSGACTDAQAIHGGVGNTQDGPFKIQDNFLEASGEAILFGGGAAALAPSDIEIVGNHFWKPWQWMPGNKPFVGARNGDPFIVKNHLELKNAVRVLVENNLIENVWGGFTQSGFAILLTPKNQHMRRGGNRCPKCQVTDVTIRYNYISHAGGGIGMATALSGAGRNRGEALAGTRFSIHDVVIDDLSTGYLGAGIAFQLSNSWSNNALNTVTIDHVTAFPDPSGSLMFVGNSVRTAPMYGLVFTNNLVLTANHPVWNTGGDQSCGAKDVPVITVKRCFTTFTFQNNGLIASPPAFPPSSWPADNMFPPTVDTVGFTNYNNGNGGNYQLLPSSPYTNAGTDGKDLGADIVGLNTALANVE